MTRALGLSVLLSAAAVLNCTGSLTTLAPRHVAAEPQASIRSSEDAIQAYRLDQAEKAIVELRVETRAALGDIQGEHRRLLWLLISNLAAAVASMAVYLWQTRRRAREAA